MQMSIRVAETLSVFLFTLFLLLRKPMGLHEAWATMIGAVLMLLLGLTTVEQSLATITESSNVLLFLLALMLFSALLDRAGFFEWAAILAAKSATGDANALYRNLFLLGALTTTILSLDTTAIILTPIVVASVQRLKLKAYPFLLACAFVANTGSLLFPISNLTNLLFQESFHYAFISFTGMMILPQLAVLLLNYWTFCILFKKDIPKDFDKELLPPAMSSVADKPFFFGSVAILWAVIAGYFVASLYRVHPFVVASAGAILLLFWAIVRQQLDRQIVKDISWSLFPFVIGLFVIVRGIENIGITDFATKALAQADCRKLIDLAAITTSTALGSNLINNIPMALLSISILKHAHSCLPNQYAALIGCNIGPNLTVTGSLATMLVITSARKKGEDIKALDFAKIGLIVTPILIIGASIAIYLIAPFIH
jgi:arsenical pump membrane protein